MGHKGVILGGRMNSLFRYVIVTCFLGFSWVTSAFAQSPEEAVGGFSTRLIEIMKGPVAKLLGVVILLVGISSLLRGRHKIAISCAAAFLVLLFLPFLMEQLGD